MTFSDVVDKWNRFDFQSWRTSVTLRQIENALSRERLSELDFLALLSDVALNFLEPMAQRAQELTRRHFGNSIVLFTPLYLSNYCQNTCAYCSFAKQHAIRRDHLTIDQIQKELALISQTGMRHLLLLTGEAPGLVTVSYLAQAVRAAREKFSSIGIEVYPLTEEDYRQLIADGVDLLTIYQEVYDELAYHMYHQGGPKEDYRFRLEAPDRACRAGIHAVTVGALLGLHDPLSETFFTGLHAAHLLDAYPGTEVGVSLPRIRPHAGNFEPPYPVDDRRFVQFLTALRLFLPTASITVSTRESQDFRNNILPLGVTKMSAGVSTAVGGHTGEQSTSQFEIADARSLEAVRKDLLRRGFQPVMQDWNSRLIRL